MRRNADTYTQKHSHSTFPFIPWSSSLSTVGTGTPHVRSLVTGLGRSPERMRASTISPSWLMTAFGDHLPSAQRRFTHASVFGWSTSSLTYICAEDLVVTVCSLLMRQRGLMRSIASSVRAQTSHWSPRASWWCTHRSENDTEIRRWTHVCATVRACTLYETVCEESRCM